MGEAVPLRTTTATLSLKLQDASSLLTLSTGKAGISGHQVNFGEKHF